MEGLIRGPAGNVRVEPKAMAVLLELARHGGEVCGREQIQRKVWPRGFTTDDVLTRCIGQLRKAFGDDPKKPRYLETLPRRGYRLLQAVGPLGPAEAPPKTDSSGADKLIVLPFQYLASDDEDYLADGMTELLTARLARLEGIQVISRTTAMHFKGATASLLDVAGRTGAHWVVEGSVIQSGNRFQVVVQLIDARTDAHLWAEDYARDIGDILLLQNEIARQVSVSIRSRLGADREKRTSSQVLPPDAVRDYLLARQLVSKRSVESLRQAIKYLDRVCDTVPDYAPAWASRAEARFMLCHYGAMAPNDAAPDCYADLNRSLSLEPDIASGLSCRGVLRFFFDRDLGKAEADLLRAVELSPDSSIAMLTLANIFAVREEFSAANSWLDRALLVDPLDVGINMNVADHYILQRRFDDAITALDATLTLEPEHRPSLLRRCWALALAGKPQQAMQDLYAAAPESEQDWQWYEYAALVASEYDAEAAMGSWETLRGLRRERQISPWSMARAAAAAGAASEAVEWLREAFRQGSTSLPFMRVTPAFHGLHGLPEFQELPENPSS